MLIHDDDRSALLCGDYREELAGIREVGAVICDPPYGARTHAGHDNGVRAARNSAKGDAVYGISARRALNYGSWTPEDVREFVQSWAPRCTGWMAVMSCDALAPVWADEMSAAGRVTFQPLPCVIWGMTVRLAGDGPSSWCVWLNVSRPRSKEFVGGWTRRGAYVGGRGGHGHIGGKPLWLMSQIVSDYARPNELVADPCAGFATTGRAALGLGHRFVGCEVDPETARQGALELARPHREEVAAELAKLDAGNKKRLQHVPEYTHPTESQESR